MDNKKDTNSLIEDLLRYKKIYNIEQKKQFIQSIAFKFKEAGLKRIIIVFNKTSFFEDLNDKDLCRFTAEELKFVFEKVEWGTGSTIYGNLKVIKEYVEYCNKTIYANNPNFDVLKLKREDIKGTLKYQSFYKDEQEFKDMVYFIFDGLDKAEFNLSNGIRYLIAMVFAYYGKDFVYDIKENEFDYETFIFKCFDKKIDLKDYKKVFLYYRESLKIKKIVPSTFFFKKECYSKNDIFKIEADGDIKIEVEKIRRIVLKDKNFIKFVLGKESFENSFKNKNIDISSVSYSGIFNRVYKQEIDNRLNKKELQKVLQKELFESTRKQASTRLMKDYQKWKEVLFL